MKYILVKELCQLMTDARIEIRDSKNIVAELKSDIEWLEEYYKKKSWNDVTRWLTNIDSTLRETFSQYIDAIKELS